MPNYYIFIRCEYKKGILRDQGNADDYNNKFWYQVITKYSPLTEEFFIGEGDIELTNKETPVYFDSLKEAKEVAKIIKVYEITEDVLDKILFSKRKDPDIIDWNIFVRSGNRSYKI